MLVVHTDVHTDVWNKCYTYFHQGYVCLNVRRIMENLVAWFSWCILEGCSIGQGRIHYNFLQIWFTDYFAVFLAMYWNCCACVNLPCAGTKPHPPQHHFRNPKWGIRNWMYLDLKICSKQPSSSIMFSEFFSFACGSTATLWMTPSHWVSFLKHWL